MRLEDLQSVTRKALAMSFGDTYMQEQGGLDNLESFKLPDIGKDVTDTVASTEKFTKSLIVVLAKNEYIQSNIKSEFDGLFKDSTEWGAFIQRVYFDPQNNAFDADPMWNLVNGQDYSSYEHKFYQPSVQAKIFENMRAGVIPISIQNETLMESFKSWDELNTYVSGIQASVQKTIAIVKKNHARMLVACGIAISNTATQTARHLLTEAIAAGIVPSGTTAKNALNNPDFLSYCAKEISKVNDEMTVESACYNNGSIVIGAEETKTYLLKDFERALRFNLKADTYHKEDRSIDGDVSTVTCWQGILENGKKFDFDTLSKIKIAADSENRLGLGVDPIEIDNVIGFSFDKRAIGFTLAKEKITSNVTHSCDFFTMWYHLKYNLVLDVNLPMCAFILD